MSVRRFLYGSLDLVFLLWSFWRILPSCASPIEERPDALNKHYESNDKSINLGEIGHAFQEDSWIQVPGVYQLEEHSEAAPESSIVTLLKRSMGAAEKDGSSVAIILIGSSAAVVSLVALTSCCFYVDKRQRPIGVYRIPTILVPDERYDEDIPLESYKTNVGSPIKENTTQFDSSSSDSRYGSRTLLYYQSTQSNYPPR